ncbi:MAG: cupin, partial [Candidatus Latescibacterota bacterium]
MKNLFDLPNPLPNQEQFDDLIPDQGVKIERIISTGQTTPNGEWYDQDRDEWVILLQGQATLEYESGPPQFL